MSGAEGYGRRVSRNNVTTACNVCRNKRRKCDAHLPCSSCRRTGERCVYDHNDRRRHQRQTDHQLPIHDSSKNATQATRTVTTGVHRVIQPNEASSQTGENASIGADTDTPKAKDSAALNAGPSLEATIDLTGGHTRARPPPMKKMQGKFRAVTNTSRARAGAANPQLHPKKTQERSRNGEQASDQPHQSRTTLMRQDKRQSYPAPGYTRTFGNLPFSCSITTNGYPAAVQAHQKLSFTTSQHLVFPLTDHDDSPLGRALTDFLRLAERLLAEGTPSAQVADPGPIDVTLYFRDRLPGDSITVSAWTAEMLKSFRGTFSDDLLLACAVCVVRLVNWYLVPTLENYAKIPSMMRPTSLQRLHPHPPWMDLMMFPSFRDALVHRSRDWVEPCMKAQWSVLWPHPTEKSLTRLATGQILLTQDFVAYIGDYKHWSMQSTILETFPEIQSSEINILSTKPG